MDKFSVLMSVYKNDKVEDFNSAFLSIKNQSRIPDQIVIVRDGPVPTVLQELLDTIESENRFVTIVSLEKNVGLSKALNIGLQHCNHEIVARMDADDISDNRRFEIQIPIFKKDPRIALISSWYSQYDSNMEDLESDRKLPETHDSIVLFSKTRTPFNHVCCAFKKSIILKVGGYPDINGFCEDWWLALRIIKSGYHLYNIPISLVKVRGGVDFYNRRRGMQYLYLELRNLLSMREHGLLTSFETAKNVAIRLPFRLLPTSIVKYFYQNLIRPQGIINN